MHPAVRHPYAGLQARLADRISGAFGSMCMFWTLVLWQLIWMAFATLGFWGFKNDRYPFVFLLFLGNLIQLWALPVLGTSQNRADQKRDAKANADHLALTHIAMQVDAIYDKVKDK